MAPNIHLFTTRYQMAQKRSIKVTRRQGKQFHHDKSFSKKYTNHQKCIYFFKRASQKWQFFVFCLRDLDAWVTRAIKKSRPSRIRCRTVHSRSGVRPREPAAAVRAAPCLQHQRDVLMCVVRCLER
jgi:hypothetical protein